MKAQQLGETGRCRLYKDPPLEERLAIFDGFPPALRRAVAEAPVLLSVSYFAKLLAGGMSEGAVVERCHRKCARIVKQLRKDGVLP